VATIHSLTQHRARRLIAELVSVQARIDGMARELLRGRSVELELDSLLVSMEKTLSDLGTTAKSIDDVDMQSAIERAVEAHQRWSTARIGTDEERSAAQHYLDMIEALRTRYVGSAHARR
jgi:hypothetical protein